MAFTAKDVQALRQSTGAGMMDAKRALEANDGDTEAAKQWLREQGLAAARQKALMESEAGPPQDTQTETPTTTTEE